MVAKTCVHCRKNAVNRPRNLCWNCYYTPGLRELYQPTSKYAKRGTACDNRNARPLGVPTPHQAGSSGKIAVLAARVAAGEELFHPLDRGMSRAKMPAHMLPSQEPAGC